VSGFRAFSRSAALQMNILSSFSYTIETFIQAANHKIALVSVPIHTNPPTRPSRLFKSTYYFVGRSLLTLMRSFAMYRARSLFFPLGALFLICGALPIARFLFLYAQGSGQGHVQSLVLGGVLLTMGALTWMIGVLADLTACNRRLLEMVLEKVRRLELIQSKLAAPAVLSDSSDEDYDPYSLCENSGKRRHVLK